MRVNQAAALAAAGFAFATALLYDKMLARRGEFRFAQKKRGGCERSGVEVG
jgi:hypothetical protein